MSVAEILRCSSESLPSSLELAMAHEVEERIKYLECCLASNSTVAKPKLEELSGAENSRAVWLGESDYLGELNPTV